MLLGAVACSLAFTPATLKADCKPADYYTRSAKVNYIQIRNPDYKKALALLNEGRACYPKNAEIYFWLGNLYGELDSIKLMSAFYDTSVSLSDKYKKEITNTRVSKWGDLFQTGLNALKADTVQSDSLKLATRLRGKERLRKATVVDPTRYEAFVNLGVAYLKLNQPESALVCYETAHKLNPKDVAIISSLAGNYFTQKRFSEAVKLYQEIVAIDPQNKDALLAMGAAYDQLGETEKVKETYLRVLQIDPKDKNVLFNMGLFALRAVADTTKHFQAILEKNPNDTKAQAEQQRIQKIYYASAESLFVRASQADTTDKYAWHYAGVCARIMDHVDEALTYQLKAVAVDDNFKDAYQELAVLYTLKNMPDKAKEAEAKSK